jgi:poly-gamma-glutamate synthesis protein (capsule biosynthesis protein)
MVKNRKEYYMKKKNIVLFALLCLLSILISTGALIFVLHYKSNTKEISASKQNTAVEESGSGSSLPVSPSPTPSDQPVLDTPSDGVDGVSATPLPSAAAEAEVTAVPTSPIVLAFAGDVSLDESSDPVAKYDAEGKDITSCFSADLLDEMKAADIMMLNNEFAYSTRGTKAADKSFTFRADPSRVHILTEMGVDIVSLANNHALDFGQEALGDTFSTLEDAEIEYVGAGENLDRAKAPIYFTVGDKTIAYVAASRVVFAMDWYATDTQAGMLGTYDPTVFIESIKEAAANSDYVVAFVHWGVERNNYPEDYQRTFAEQYIDDGADAVIGSQPHVVQGYEFYKGKPIAYSLGNYWFNDSTRDSAFLKLYLEPEGDVKIQLLPATNADTVTYLYKEPADKKKYYDFIRKISFGVDVDEDGYLTEAAQE